MSVPQPSLTQDIAAAIDWWRAAGVDLEFGDDATAWLVDAPPEEANDSGGATGLAAAMAPNRGTIARQDVPAAMAAPINLLGDSPPQTLEQFRQFWLTAPGLDAIGPRGRVPPRGNANPELMVLVIDPEEGDSDQLLSGAQGRLLANMLTAMGMSEDQVYIASALPRHTPMADTTAAAQAGLGAVLARHVELVAPKRLLAFGLNVLPLFQHGVTKGETSLREINHSGSSQTILVSEGLDSLMSMPTLKARFWRRWMEWSAHSS